MKKEYSLPLMNDHYRGLLEMVIHNNGEMDSLGSSQIKRVRPTYNRLCKNPVWKKVAERGDRWDLVELERHITEGEIIANADTFLWYLLDRYGNREQITLDCAAKDEECIHWHFEELTRWLAGLSVRYPDLIDFGYTLGLTSLIFCSNL